jgi:hypothetical protein
MGDISSAFLLQLRIVVREKRFDITYFSQLSIDIKNTTGGLIAVS